MCTESKKKKLGVSVAIIIEMIRMLSWRKKMYVMSRGKQIKTARFIFKELFAIEIQSNHEPSLKHKPTNNNFICH